MLLIVSAGYLGQFIGALVIGALSDRIGRRNAFILCLTVFGALALACASAGSASSLVLFRLLQGLGLGAEVPIAATLVNEYLGRRNRGRFSVVYQRRAGSTRPSVTSPGWRTTPAPAVMPSRRPPR